MTTTSGPDTAASSSSSAVVNLSEWIAHAIADTGCTVVYGGHGGALVPLVNAVCAHPALTWVCARNEHDAATMAAAHAKMTGQLGVVLATSGPGATNLTTGLLEATLDRLPLLALTGLKPTAVLGYSEFQDLNQSRLLAGAGVEWSKDAASAHAVIPLLRDAVATALSRRTCAHLAIPVDLQAAPSPLALKHFCASHAALRLQPAPLDPHDPYQQRAVVAAATTLLGAPESRPPRNVLAVGLWAAYYHEHNMSQLILDLAEALNAPVLTRLQAKGLVDEYHPLSLGVMGVHGKPGLETAAQLVSTSDCIITIGVEDASLLLCNAAGLQIRKLIELQPDAVAVGTRFNAEHTLVGDLAGLIQALALQVETLRVKLEKKRAIHTASVLRQVHEAEVRSRLPLAADTFHETVDRQVLMDQFGYMALNNPRAVRSTSGGVPELAVPEMFDDEFGPEAMIKSADQLWELMHQGNWRKLIGHTKRLYCHHDPRPGYCHPEHVLHALSDLLLDPNTDAVAKDAVVTVDVGDVTLWASLCLHLTGGKRTLYSEHLGTMGYALNAGIPAILSKSGPAAAIVLAGDAGFQMSLQELATFQQTKRPGDKLICIVFDNQIMGRVAFGFEHAAGCEMLGPDYVLLAKAYGGDGVRLDDSSRAMEVVKQALQSEGLFMIHCIVDPEVKADMASFKDTSLKVMNSG